MEVQVYRQNNDLWNSSSIGQSDYFFNMIFTEIIGDYVQRNIVVACHDCGLKPEWFY